MKKCISFQVVNRKIMFFTIYLVLSIFIFSILFSSNTLGADYSEIAYYGGEVITEFKNHKDEVISVDYEPEKKWVVSGSKDGQIIVWRALNGKIINKFGYHEGKINQVAFSPDGKLVAFCSDDCTVKVWEPGTDKIITDFTKHDSAVTSLAFFSGGKKILTGSTSGEIKIWDVQTGKIINNFSKHKYDITSIDISPDGKRVVSGSSGKRVSTGMTTTGIKGATIKVWDINTGELLTNIEDPHSQEVKDVAFSPGGGEVFSVSKEIKIWDISNNKNKKDLSVSGIDFTVDSLSLSKRGRMLTVNDDDNVLIVCVDTGEIITRFRKHSNSVLTTVMTKNNRYVVSGDEDGQIIVWKWYEKNLSSEKTGNRSSVENFEGNNKQEKIITFVDKNLEIGVRKKINCPWAPIYFEEVKNITSLSVKGTSGIAADPDSVENGITSLEGIQYLHNLEILSLGRQQYAPMLSAYRRHYIEDISPLAKLKELKKLDLSENIIKDISPLAKLDKLEVLDLTNNKIENISPLLEMDSLKEVNISYNKPLDFSEGSKASKIIKKLEKRGVKVGKRQN